MELYVKQNGGAVAGRAVSFIKLDDESEPPKAPELTTKLVQGEKVDVLIARCIPASPWPCRRSPARTDCRPHPQCGR